MIWAVISFLFVLIIALAYRIHTLEASLYSKLKDRIESRFDILEYQLNTDPSEGDSKSVYLRLAHAHMSRKQLLERLPGVLATAEKAHAECAHLREQLRQAQRQVHEATQLYEQAKGDLTTYIRENLLLVNVLPKDQD